MYDNDDEKEGQVNPEPQDNEEDQRTDSGDDVLRLPGQKKGKKVEPEPETERQDTS